MGYKQEIRVGIGYDVHAFAAGRKLILGGVEIPHDEGLVGHSDADVVLHAVCDAILGAAAMGDIGKHFPDSEEQYRGISSMKLLRKVLELIGRKGYRVGNIDVTIIAQKPKLAPYINKMIYSISEGTKLEESRISIKATTTEGLGFTGRSEGIAACAVALIVKE